MDIGEVLNRNLPLDEFVESLAIDIRSGKTRGMVADSKLGKITSEIEFETYTRIGTQDKKDPRFQRETNRRVIIYNHDKNLGKPGEFSFPSIQFVIYNDGTTKVLNPPKQKEWVEKLLGVELSVFPQESED